MRVSKLFGIVSLGLLATSSTFAISAPEVSNLLVGHTAATPTCNLSEFDVINIDGSLYEIVRNVSGAPELIPHDHEGS